MDRRAGGGGRTVRLFIALYGMASLLLAAAAVPVAVVAPLGLDLQRSALDRAAAQILFASPLLLLGGAIAAFLVLRKPTALRLTAMFLPLVAIALAAALAAAR